MTMDISLLVGQGPEFNLLQRKVQDEIFRILTNCSIISNQQGPEEMRNPHHLKTKITSLLDNYAGGLICLYGIYMSNWIVREQYC